MTINVTYSYSSWPSSTNVKMQNLQEFLKTSTIHGFPRIASSTKRYLKIFWFLVVVTGFSVSGSFKYNALYDFENKPFTTTIETQTFPISQLKFPSIIVCPPKGSFTNLNYDLVNLKKEDIRLRAGLNNA